LLRIPPPSEQQLTEEEIETLIDQAARTGVFAPVESQMVARIFRLNDRRIETLMTPRSEIVWLDLDEPSVRLQSILAENRFTKLPVARGDLDNLLGVIHVKDLLPLCFSGQSLDFEAVLERALVVPESMPALKVLERFREYRTRIAMVMDEFGGILGLVTTTDLLEKIVGELPEAGGVHDPDIVKRADGSWLLDGMLPADEIKEILHLRSLPGEEENYFQTLGGFVINHLDRIPSTGDYFVFEQVRFEVVDMDGRRVDKILATPVNSEFPDPDP
jgi:putative hemolysin